MEADQAYEKTHRPPFRGVPGGDTKLDPRPCSSLKNQNSLQELCQVGLALGAPPAWHTFSSGI